jgi:hypothetical protein
MPSPDHDALHRRTLSASSLAATDPDPTSTRLPERSPHPYHRRKSDLTQPTAAPVSLSSSTSLHASAVLNSTSSTGSASSLAGAARRAILSPSESGTEADDEGSGLFFKALPAPPFRPRKGLRGADEADATPLLTPTKLDGEVLRLSDVGIREPGAREPVLEEHEEERVGRSKRVRRRRAEILRRLLEVGLIAVAGAAVLWRQGAWRAMNWGERGRLLLQEGLCQVY